MPQPFVDQPVVPSEHPDTVCMVWWLHVCQHTDQWRATCTDSVADSRDLEMHR